MTIQHVQPASKGETRIRVLFLSTITLFWSTNRLFQTLYLLLWTPSNRRSRPNEDPNYFSTVLGLFALKDTFHVNNLRSCTTTSCFSEFSSFLTNFDTTSRFALIGTSINPSSDLFDDGDRWLFLPGPWPSVKHVHEWLSKYRRFVRLVYGWRYVATG